MRAFVCAAAALLAVAGCGRAPPPVQAESRIPAGLETRFYPPPGWAWGWLDVSGAPPVRYGVAAPSRAARAQVVILVDAGEPAEAWFETAAELVARNAIVWILDRPGQGGSGRWPRAEGRVHTPSMALDLAALRAMLAEAVRPDRGPPVILVGDGLGAQLALRGLAAGLPGVAGAVLGDPMLTARAAALPGPGEGALAADWLARLGLGRIPAPGAQAWPDLPAPGRGRPAVAQAWMRANPGLRIGGPTLGWIAAYNRSAAAARDPQALAKIAAPVVILARPRVAGEGRAACRAIPACRFEALGVEGPAPHLAADPVRGRWLTQTADFIEARASDPFRIGLKQPDPDEKGRFTSLEPASAVAAPIADQGRSRDDAR